MRRRVLVARFPLRRGGLVGGRELRPAAHVVIVPKAELQYLGLALDVQEVVHEVVEGAGLSMSVGSQRDEVGKEGCRSGGR